MRTQNERLTELVELANRRRDLAKDGAEVDARMGAMIRPLLREGVSQSRVGRRIGVSHTHVKALAERVESDLALPTPEQGWRDVLPRVPVLMPAVAGQFVTDTARRITYIVTGAGLLDAFLASGLDPERMPVDGHRLLPPRMLWRLDDGHWVGVEDVQFGYGGTGPSNTVRALTAAGVDEALALDVAGHGWAEVDLVEQTEQLGPRSMTGRFPHAFLEQPGCGRAYVHTITGDLGGEFEAWVDFLDRPAAQLPRWLRGERTARVFLEPQAATSQGFTMRAVRSTGSISPKPATVVIEQGRFQLWLRTFTPEPPRRLSDETYDSLAKADLYPNDLAQLDSRSRFQGYLDRMLGREPVRPDWFDISRSGTGELSSVPGTDVDETN